MTKSSKTRINTNIFQKLPFIDDFLLFLMSRNYSQATIKNYERDLQYFDTFLESHQIEFSSITKKTLTQYISDLRDSERETLRTHKHGQSMNPKSINRMLTSLRSYISYLIDMDEEVPILPQHIKLMKLDKQVLHIPNIEIMIEFIESPEYHEKDSFIGLRNRTILEMIFASGMRISEATSLTMEQIEESGKLYVKGKGSKERFVYLTPRSLSLLQQYLQARSEKIYTSLPPSFQKQTYVDQFQYLFITKKTFDTLAQQIVDQTLPSSLLSSHISANYLQSKIKSYRLLSGISHPISAHTLRHGFATYLAESGASPVALKVLLGHESLETTTRYVHVSDRFAEDTHESYHPLKK